MFVDADMRAVERIPCAGGEALVHVRKRPGRAGCNEDAAMVAAIDDRRAVLMVADGAGGLPEGAFAARVAVDRVVQALVRRAPHDDLRACVRAALEDAHRTIAAVGHGAATTANLVLIDGDQLWSLHVGDSVTLVIDGAGACKLRTVPHSPVGIKVRDGVLSEEQAIRDAELHLVHNLLGVGCCHVDPSGLVRLDAGDTILIATDGLFDNLVPREVISRVSGEGLGRRVEEVAAEAWRRMTDPAGDDPSKPDDLAVVAFRRALPG